MNNNINCDYIGAIGSYPIIDYVDNTSNILDNKINITSNILSNNIINVDVKYNNLIRSETEGILKHTYITNSNIQGQIRFITRFDNNDYRYKTRIKENGEIEVYYPEYNPIFPTMLVGWYNVMSSIRDAYNYQNIATELIGGTAFAINDIYQKYYGLVAATGAHLSGITAGQLTKERFAEITLAASKVVKYNRFNEVAVVLGITGLGVAGITYSVFNGIRYDNITNNILYDLSNLDLNVYSNITSNEKYSALSNLKNDTNSNIIETNNNLISLNILNGFINSNIQTQQYINSLNTIDFRIDNINISNIYVASNVLSNINLNDGFINSNTFGEQYINNLKCNNLTLNNGNISNINGISTNEIIASGKIKQNGILLDNTYLTSNHLYNLAFNYTTERQYPSKLYTSSSTEETATLLNKLVYKQTLFLDTSSISYGNGFYEVYSSSTFDIPTTKDKLFNFNTTETTTSARWGISLYSSGTGDYQSTDNINGYYGDWVIIKMPLSIMLTRYRIYQRSDFPTKAPAEWKVYGSTDGITFTEITEASQMTRLTSYTSGFYEKTLASTFTTQYQYFGFVFNKLLSTSGQTDLSFAELQIFGKEIISNSIVSNIYATSNAVKYIVQYEMPLVAKHYGFYITINTSININGTTYYKYDIDLTPYTQKGIIQIGPQSGDTFRSFKIRVMLGTMYFSYIINDLPNVCYYEVFMSYKNTAAPPGVAGLNACAIGYPHNPTLQTIMPNNLFVIKNGAGSIDYITVVSTSPADVRVIIEDLLG